MKCCAHMCIIQLYIQTLKIRLTQIFRLSKNIFPSPKLHQNNWKAKEKKGNNYCLFVFGEWVFFNLIIFVYYLYNNNIFAWGAQQNNTKRLLVLWSRRDSLKWWWCFFLSLSLSSLVCKSEKHPPSLSLLFWCRYSAL